MFPVAYLRIASAFEGAAQPSHVTQVLVRSRRHQQLKSTNHRIVGGSSTVRCFAAAAPNLVVSLGAVPTRIPRH